MEYSRGSISILERMKRIKEIGKGWRYRSQGEIGKIENIKRNNEPSIKGDNPPLQVKANGLLTDKYKSIHSHHIISSPERVTGLGMEELVGQSPCHRHCTIQWKRDSNKSLSQYWYI